MTATHGEGVYGNGVGVTTPLEHKLAQVTEFVKTTTPNLIRPGVLYNGDASLVVGKSNMSYDVKAATFVSTRGASAGVVKWANDGVFNAVTTAAPGSNSRIDIVFAWPREYSLDGVDSNPVISVTQGTAAASPVAPSLAGFPGAIELARIIVPAGVVATNSGTTITQTAPFTTVDGGTYAVRTTTERDAITNALTDQKVFCLADSQTYRWNGSAWCLASGSVAYIPTLTGITVGNGTLDSHYTRSGNMVTVEGTLTIGSTTTLTAAFKVGTPTTMDAKYAIAGSSHVLGVDTIYDVGTARYTGHVYSDAASNRVALYVGQITGGLAVATPATNGLIIYATGDQISWSFTYLAA